MYHQSNPIAGIYGFSADSTHSRLIDLWHFQTSPNSIFLFLLFGNRVANVRPNLHPNRNPNYLDKLTEKLGKLSIVI